MPSNAATTAAIYNLKLYGRLFAFAPRLRSCVRAHRILQFIILFLEKIKQKNYERKASSSGRAFCCLREGRVASEECKTRS